MRPYDITDQDQLLAMESDNHPQDSSKFSILHQGALVSIHKPYGSGFMTIPRDDFNAIVDWYMADQPSVTNK